jgi:methyl-accepting chemotaxis protein
MLNDLRISYRLFGAFLLPIVVVCVLAALAISAKWQLRSEMNTLNAFAEKVSVVGKLVHELQRERGMSVLFLASKGSDMRAELPKQREAADVRVKEMNAALSDLTTISSSATLSRDVDQIRSALAGLPATRQGVDSLSIERPAVFAFYTELINSKLFPLVSGVIKLSTNSDASRLVASYQSLMRAKEMAGQERAVGAAGLAAGRFEPKIYARLASLGAAQDAYFSSYEATASEHQLALLARLKADPLTVAVAGLRQKIFDKGLEGNIDGVDSASWWAATSKRIDLLKTMEDETSADLLVMTGGIAADAAHNLLIIVLSLLAVLVVGAALTVIIARSITVPVTALTGTMRRMAEGELDNELGGKDRGDEIGEMARAVEVFRQHSKERETLNLAVAETHAKEIRQQQELNTALQGFKKTISESIDVLLREVGGLRDVSGSLLTASGRANTEAVASSGACSEAALSAQAVAAATEQLDASIREIAGQAHQTSAIIGRTTERAQIANAEVVKLTEVVTKINGIVTLIRTIAQQTNLLALNATIESARAGEAGRGFAVVAAEVKALSEQTARATDDIAHQIQSVQLTTNGVVDAIREIVDQIGDMHGMSASVAAAVEEQQAATADIARNVQVSATSSERAAEGSRIMIEVAEQSGGGAKQVATVSDALQAISTAVSGAVDVFIGQISSDLSDRRAASRLSVERPVVLTGGGKRIEVRALDVSVSGMRTTTVDDLAKGDRVTIDFGFDRVEARVVWRTAEGCGFEFATHLSQEQAHDQRWHLENGQRQAA